MFILRNNLADRITNEKLCRAEMHYPVLKIVRSRILRFAGHVLRMTESMPASVALNWLQETGRTSRGR